jgi:hypothetical protein
MSASWVVCPACQLKHTARPDGVCPRCKTTIAGSASPVPVPDAAPPGAPVRPEAPEPQFLTRFSSPGRHAPEAEVTKAARIAGGVLILNAVLVVAERALMQATSDTPSSPVSYVIDLILGAMLLAGKGKALPWAKVRVILALVLLPAILAFSGNPTGAVLQALYCAGLLGLLVGAPGTIRTVAAAIAIALCFTLEAAGLFSLATGRPLAARADVEAKPVTQVEGVEFRYRLTAPNDRWRLRKTEVAKKDNPLTDRWLVRPDQDAHVIVIAEIVPGSDPVDMDVFEKVVTENSRKSWQQFSVVTQEDLPTRLEAGRLLHTQGKIKGLTVECYHGLFIQGRSIFQVWGFVEKARFPLVKEDFSSLISSFEIVGS